MDPTNPPREFFRFQMPEIRPVIIVVELGMGRVLQAIIPVLLQIKDQQPTQQIDPQSVKPIIPANLQPHETHFNHNHNPHHQSGGGGSGGGSPPSSDNRSIEQSSHHHGGAGHPHPIKETSEEKPPEADNNKDVQRQNGTGPMPPVGPKEGPKDNNISKDKLELLAKLIEKLLMPEKIAVQAPRPQMATMTTLQQPQHISKDDKTAVEQTKKDPQNSNLAVPKESVKPAGDQATFNKPQNVDKPQSTVQPMPPVQPKAKEENAVINKDAGQENIAPKNNPQTQNSEKPSATSTLQLTPENASNAPQLVQPQQATSISPYLAPQRMPERNMASSELQQKVPQVQPQAPLAHVARPAEPMGMHKNLQAGFYIKDLGLPINQPIGTMLNKQNHNSDDSHRQARTDAIHAAEKHVKPRRDALPSLDKNENVPRQPVHRFDDDRQIARMPILPDLPLTREGVLKDNGNPKDVHLREDEGYKFGDMLLMVLCAVICGQKNATEITRYLESQEKFFTAWLGLKNGRPTFRMLWFLLNRLDPTNLESLLLQALGKAGGKDSLVHKINVWESNRGLTLGELTPLMPGAEALSLSESLDMLDLNGAIVNIDAPSLKNEIARKVKWNGGDYIMTLKGCHGSTYEQALEFFEATIKERKDEIRIDTFRDLVKDGKRHELREITVTDELSWFEQREEWPFLKASVQLISQSAAGSRIATEKRIYLTSLSLPAEHISKTIRMLSVIEGHVDWLVDCDFLFNGTKGLVENEQKNIAILRKFSNDMLVNDTSKKGTTEAKRKKALADHDYLRILIDSQAA